MTLKEQKVEGMVARLNAVRANKPDYQEYLKDKTVAELDDELGYLAGCTSDIINLAKRAIRDELGERLSREFTHDHHGYDS